MGDFPLKHYQDIVPPNMRALIYLKTMLIAIFACVCVFILATKEITFVEKDDYYANQM